MRTRSILPALFFGVLAFLAYRFTAAPGMLLGDAGEFQFSVPNMGLPHPTGYPLYHMLGWLWGWLYRTNPAQGVNHFSAFWGGVAVMLFYLLVYELFSQVLARLRWSSGAAVLAAVTTLIFAGNPTLWAQATQAEVYTLHVAIVAGILGASLALGRKDYPAASIWVVVMLLGLGLTHHLTIVLILPALIVYLLIVRPDVFGLRKLLVLAPFVLLPLLLYAYVPLREAASPWFRVPLAPGQTLDLLDSSPIGLLRYILGLDFAPALRTPAAAFAQIPAAALLYLQHFGWVGLAIILLGIVAMVLEEQIPALIFTALAFFSFTIFNLFYGIGDIQAFYLPPLLIATVWLGLGLAYIVEALTRVTSTRLRPYLLALTLAALALPALLFQTYRPQFDRSGDWQANQRWTEIMAQELPADSVLVSNDRDEITPMLYQQHVEGKAPGMTGLFPLLDDGPTWEDLNATLSSALATGRPVYAIKPMPGIESHYRVQPGAAGLWRVLGPQMAPDPSFEQPYSDYLRWLNVEWSGDTAPGGEITVTLFWRVTQTPPSPWHSFLQILSPTGEKVTQADDHRPGGDYLPAPLWKVGDIVVDRFTLPLPTDLPPGDYILAAGFYDPATNQRLADPLPVAVVQSP